MAVVAVVAVVRAVGDGALTRFRVDVDVAAAIYVVIAGVNLAHLVVPDEDVRLRLADLDVVVLYECMEGEVVFAHGEVGHVGVEVVVDRDGGVGV